MRALILGGLWVLLFSPVAAETGAEDAVDALQEVSRRLTRSQVVRGDFVQRRHLKILSRPLTSTGRFFHQKNIGAAWRVESPYPSTIYITAHGEVYSPQQQPMAAEFGQLLLALLTVDSEQLNEHFQVATELLDAQWSLTLKPRSKQWRQAVREIVASGDSAVRKIEIHENGGDHTVVSLENTNHAPLLSEQEKTEFLRAVGQSAQ